MSRYLRRTLWLAAFFLLCFGAGVVLQQAAPADAESAAVLSAEGEPGGDCPVSAAADGLGVMASGLASEQAADPSLQVKAEATEQTEAVEKAEGTTAAAVPQTTTAPLQASATAAASSASSVSAATAPATAAEAQTTAAAAAAAPEQPVRMVLDTEDDDEPRPSEPKKTVNFASVTSGAVVLEHSPTSKNFHNLLVDDMDKYGMSPCNDKKWVVISLSEDIRIHTVVLANYEKYSSPVKEFQVLGSTSYPVPQWMDLGTYTAENKLGEQKFEIEPRAWVRYLKIRFLTHYSREFFCTLSQIKVHGSTMMENLKEEWKQSDENFRKIQNAMATPDDDAEEEEEALVVENKQPQPTLAEKPGASESTAAVVGATAAATTAGSTSVKEAAQATAEAGSQPDGAGSTSGASSSNATAAASQQAATTPHSEQSEKQDATQSPKEAPTGAVPQNGQQEALGASNVPKQDDSSSSAKEAAASNAASSTATIATKTDVPSPSKEGQPGGATTTATGEASAQATADKPGPTETKAAPDSGAVAGKIDKTAAAAVAEAALAAENADKNQTSAKPSAPAAAATAPQSATANQNSGTAAQQTTTAAAAVEAEVKPVNGKNRTHQTNSSAEAQWQKVESQLASLLFPTGYRRILQNSTACINMLKFQEYKDKMLAKVPDLAGSGKEKTQSGAASPTENIFQGLLQKVHSMEFNQAVVEKYLASVHECYGLLLHDAHKTIGELQELVSLQSASSVDFDRLDVQDISALLSVPVQMARREWDVLSRTIATDPRDFEYRLLFVALWCMSSLSLLLSISLCVCFGMQRRPSEKKHKKAAS